MVVALPPVEGGDEQLFWLEILFSIALELVAAVMDVFLAEGFFSLCRIITAEIRLPLPSSAIEMLIFLDTKSRALVALECWALPNISSTSHLKSLLPPSLAEPLPGSPSPVLTPCNPVPPPSPSRLCLLSASRKWSGSNGPRSRCFGFWVA